MSSSFGDIALFYSPKINKKLRQPSESEKKSAANTYYTCYNNANYKYG